MHDQIYTAVGWKAIPGYSCYEISTEGQVRRCKNTEGMRRNAAIGVPLKVSIAKNGYPCINIVGDNGKWRVWNIHALLGMVFLKKPSGNESQVAHDDDNKSNFKLSNLSWKTPAGNGEDSSRNRRPPNGNRHCNVKIPDEMIPIIRAWPGRAEMLARDLGVRTSTINRIRAGTERRHAIATGS